MESSKKDEIGKKHYTHNTSNSSLSSHDYFFLNESKKSSIISKNKEEEKNPINNINNNYLNLRGTIKVDKTPYIKKEESQKLFEDINLQYIEPLEGVEESEEQDDGTYRKYLNKVREELDQKKDNIVFINDLGLNNNLLNINEIFDKIKKKSRFKNRNSFLSVNKNKNEDILPKIENQIPKEKIRAKRPLGFKAIRNLFMSKIELRKNLKNIRRILTYDNSKNINYYYKNKNALLNIRERKKIERKLKSQKIFKKVKKGQLIEDSEEDIFGNKKKNKIKDSFSLLDFSKKDSKIIPGNKSKEETKQKSEEKIEPKNDNFEQKIKKINPSNKKNKKKNIIPEKKNVVKPKKNYFLNKSKFNRPKGSKQFNIIKLSNNSKNKLKSPAINSILNDIKDLSKSILENGIRKHKDKNKTILYDKHFGYEYWKENEIIKSQCHNIISNRKSKSYRTFYSPKKDVDTFSVISSNFSWLYNQKNTDDILDYDTDFTCGANSNSLNPYSINWTKNMIQNSYNRKIKLNSKMSYIPKIELVRVQSSFTNRSREKINYNIYKNNNELFRKTSKNMFGRIYKNNEIEFPMIKKI